jgi:adenylate kinase
VIKLHDKYFKPFLSQTVIQSAVENLAKKIADDHKGETPIFIGVITGSLMNVADFLKA